MRILKSFPINTFWCPKLLIDLDFEESTLELLTVGDWEDCVSKYTLSAALLKLSSPLYNRLSFLSSLIYSVCNIYSISFIFSFSSYKSLFISSLHSCSICWIWRRRGWSLSALLFNITCVLDSIIEFKEFLIFLKFYKSSGRILYRRVSTICAPTGESQWAERWERQKKEWGEHWQRYTARSEHIEHFSSFDIYGYLFFHQLFSNKIHFFS